MAIKPKMMKKGITKQSFDDVMGGDSMLTRWGLIQKLSRIF
jgi:hypothetical protein